MSSNKNEETKGIKATLVLEMVGRPKEHIEKSMEKILEQMKGEKGVAIESKNIKEPVELKENKDFFTTFAEVDIEVEEIANIAIIMFKYMPAHIEITRPETIALTNNGWSDILSELVRRLHGYDEVARTLQFKNAKLEKKIKELTDKEKKD